MEQKKEQKSMPKVPSDGAHTEDKDRGMRHQSIDEFNRAFRGLLLLNDGDMRTTLVDFTRIMRTYDPKFKLSDWADTFIKGEEEIVEDVDSFLSKVKEWEQRRKGQGNAKPDQGNTV